MNEDPKPDIEQRLSLIFSALGDPTRRKLLSLLREAGELKVGHLAEAFEISLNGVSKHVKVLERAGLIRRRIEGRVHWIHVDWSGLAIAYDWLDAQKHFWDQRLDALEHHLENSVDSRKDHES